MITTHKKNLIQRCLERGYSLHEVDSCVVNKNGDIWTIDETHPSYPIQKKNKISQESNIGEGVGTELKKILGFIGINSSPNCSCNAKAKMMNEKGVEWCKNNIDVIVSWLKEEASKRNLPFYSFIAKKLVKIAIGRVER
jgi:hypothetical protein